MRAWLLAISVAAALLCTPHAHASLEGDCVWEGGAWAPTVWEADVWEESTCGVPPVSVPNVVGQASAAAADTILEGDGLDLGAETESCSVAANNSIIRQNPAAGVQVSAGTTVDVVSSNGVACTGRPLSINVRERVGL